jgi:alcohol dehydrogenase class IV
LDFPNPDSLRAGPREGAPVICRRNGIRRPLLVTDRGSRNLPFIGEMMQSLAKAGLSVGLFAEISPNPTDREVEERRHAFERDGHDAVLAVGGGSGMAGGKAISLIAGREEPIWSFDFDFPPNPRQPASCRSSAFPRRPARGRRRKARR